MSKILLPSNGPEDWKRFLAQPDLHWATGYSARTLANSWEAANGLPPEVAETLAPVFGKTELLFAIPEHKTPLPGGRRESQSDVLALIRHDGGLITCTVEGKVDEPFGPTVAEWRASASPGRETRLRFLCDTLGIGDCPGEVNYQLLHRTASALIEAERFGAKDAAMIVHSFSPYGRWFDSFVRFAKLFGCTPEMGRAFSAPIPKGPRLALGWACGDQMFRRL